MLTLVGQYLAIRWRQEDVPDLPQADAELTSGVVVGHRSNHPGQ